MKIFIQKLLRESLLFREAEKEDKTKKGGEEQEVDDAKEKDDDEEAESELEKGKRDYVDVQDALNKTSNPLAPSQVGVMQSALGWEDDEKGVNRSLFGKKLHQEVIDGVLYQFDEDELDSIRVQLGFK